MKKVQFSNGKFGIRKYWFFGWYFRDLKCRGLTWNENSDFFSDCMGSESEVDRVMQRKDIDYCVLPDPKVDNQAE